MIAASRNLGITVGGKRGWALASKTDRALKAHSVHVTATEENPAGPRVEQSFLLQRVQPAMTGLIDGSLSTLAPIFAVALATHRPHYAFIAGLATAIGAGVSMAYSEGLSDTGELTGRGNPVIRGGITGFGTFIGGILHTLPFLIPHYHAALVVASFVVGFELVALAWLRFRF